MLLWFGFIVLIMVVSNINDLINAFLSFWRCFVSIFNRLVKSMLLLMSGFNVIALQLQLFTKTCTNFP